MIGTRVSHFRIERELSAPEVGLAWAATDERTGQTVVLEPAPAALEADPAGLEAWLRDLEQLSAIGDARIPRWLERVQHEGATYVVSEAWRGEPLSTLLEPETAPRRGWVVPRRSGIDHGPGLSGTRAGVVAEQVAAALATAHAVGVVHGDLRAANVLVAGDKVELVGFGRWRGLAEPERLPHAGTPEGDVHAVGVLIGLLSGRPGGGAPALSALADHCLSLEPSARDVAAQLKQLQAPRPRSTARQASKWVLVLMVFLGGLLFLRTSPSKLATLLPGASRGASGPGGAPLAPLDGSSGSRTAVEIEPPVPAAANDPLIGSWRCTLPDRPKASRKLAFEPNGLYQVKSGLGCDGTWRATGGLEYRQTGACATSAEPTGKPLQSTLRIDLLGKLHIQDAGKTNEWECDRLTKGRHAVNKDAKVKGHKSKAPGQPKPPRKRRPGKVKAGTTPAPTPLAEPSPGER